jgi:hypothetical protein
MRDVVLNILNFEDTPTPISTKRFQKPIVASSLANQAQGESKDFQEFCEDLMKSTRSCDN